MPKKTKKQKLLARLRRNKQTNIPKTSPSTALPSYSYIASDKQIPKSNKVEIVALEKTSTDYLTSDLRKTLILTMLAILFELVLYWLWR